MKKELLAVSASFDLMAFGLLSLVQVPVILGFKDPLAIVTLVAYLLYLLATSFVFAKIPRWTKTKAGVSHIFRWMCVRV